jgi:uncharacterized protein
VRPADRGRGRLGTAIVDGHCHAGTGDGLTGPWDTRADLGRYLERASAAGIGRTVLFAAFHSDYAAANRQVAAIVAGNPERFIGFVFVHAERDRGRVAAMVEEMVGAHGFQGIKLHRHDARITREVCEVARAWRLPVLYDPAGELGPVEMAATEYPDVAFIVPHLSSFADDWQAQLAFVDQLGRHRNLHADTSGVRRHDLLEAAVATAGPDRVLFGSDGPWLHPGVELARVLALRLPPAAERLVLGGNRLRLIARARRPRRRSAPVTAAS